MRSSSVESTFSSDDNALRITSRRPARQTAAKSSVSPVKRCQACTTAASAVVSTSTPLATFAKR
ncbi:hypothetical protein D9M72_433130 [compost metagenome]